MNKPKPHKKAEDERLGFTSASNAEADLLCPGRHLAQQNTEEPAITSPEAESGTRIHAFLEGQQINLTPDEQDTADLCEGIHNQLFKKLFEGQETLILREERQWIDFGEGVKHSGKADIVVVGQEFAWIEDFKSGRAESPASPRNLQLRDLAALLHHNYKVKKVKVCIIQPWVTHTPEICEYDEADLKTALADMRKRVVLSHNPKALRIVGPVQCLYCRAKSNCDVFLASSLPAASEIATPAIVKDGILALTSDQLGRFYALVKLAEKVAYEEVSRRLDAGEPVQGWEFKPGRETETIVEPTTVYNRSLSAGITHKDFMGTVKVGKADLKDLLRAVTGAKGRDLEVRFGGLIEGCTETKTSKPVLSKA